MPDSQLARPSVWKSSRQFGAGSSLPLAATGPVALLAGFSLATAVSLAGDPQNALLSAGIFAFSVAVVSLVLCLLVTVEVLYYWATPSDRLSWVPEAKVSHSELERVRTEQHQDFELLVMYHKRIRVLLSTGLVAAVFGFGLSIVGRMLPPDMSLGESIPLLIELARDNIWVMGTVAVLIMALLIILATHFERARFLAPGLEEVEHVKPGAIDDVALAGLIPASGIERHLFYPFREDTGELRRVAYQNGVSELYTHVQVLMYRYCDAHYTTSSALVAVCCTPRGYEPVLAVHPFTSNADAGIHLSYSVDALAAVCGIPVEDVPAETGLVEESMTKREVSYLPAQCWIGDVQRLRVYLSHADRLRRQPAE